MFSFVQRGGRQCSCWSPTTLLNATLVCGKERPQEHGGVSAKRSTVPGEYVFVRGRERLGCATNARRMYRIGTTSRVVFEFCSSARQVTSFFEDALRTSVALHGQSECVCCLSCAERLIIYLFMQEGDRVIACVCDQRLGSWRHGVVANLERYPPRNEVGRQFVALCCKRSPGFLHAGSRSTGLPGPLPVWCPNRHGLFQSISVRNAV